MLFLNIKKKRFLIKFIMEWTVRENQSMGLIGSNMFKCMLIFFILPAVSLFYTNVADETLNQTLKKYF